MFSFAKSTVSRRRSFFPLPLYVLPMLVSLQFLAGLALADAGKERVAISPWLKVTAEVTHSWKSQSPSPERASFTAIDPVASTGTSTDLVKDKKVLFVFPKNHLPMTPR